MIFFICQGGGDRVSYSQGQGQGPVDPYNQAAGDPYSRSRGYQDSYNRGGTTNGSRDPYGDGYGEYRGSEDHYGRVDPYGRGSAGQTGYSQGQGGYGAAGDSENYPSSYSAIPIPGKAPQKGCTGSGCCVPKCFAEKGSRVSYLQNKR